MTPAQRKNFNRLLRPRQIAFIGGTDAGVAINEAQRRGYAGEIWPVNPKRAEMAGLPCFASLDDLPGTPDAIFVAVPANAAIDVIAKAAAMGVGGVVCYAAGFREAGDGGVKREEALLEAAGDMALIGPNCYGMINYLDGAALWPFAHGGSCPGYGAAVITQSGMFSSDITMSQRSLPLTHMISAGNQTVLGMEDFVDVLCEIPAVRAIGLHIEGLQDVARFERMALKALSHNTPIVAMKTGRSAIGSALTQSHTGSLSGANELYDALFERCGVIAVDSPSQFIETLKYLCIAGAPKGNRVAGFTCSGGGAAMLADHSETINLSYPAFDADAKKILEGLLPDIATVSNPLDYTTPIWGQPERTLPVFTEAIARAGVDAAILVQDYPAQGLDETKHFYLADAEAFGEAAKQAGVPAAICSTIHENMDADTRAALMAAGIAPMQGIHEALNAISHGRDWAQAHARIVAADPAPLLSAPMPDEIEMISEAEGKDLLRAAGLSVPQGVLVNGAGAPGAAEKLGYPVVLKMMGPKLAHKTEAGAVKLGLGDAAAVQAAVCAMIDAVQAYDADAVTDDFLVEQMVARPVVEMIVGIRRDAQFGLAMTIGSGGILVELLADAETLLLPASADDIKRAISRLKLFKLLNGFRGNPVVDLDRLSQTLAALGNYAMDHARTVAEIEINPLFVYHDGVRAVDALIHRIKP
ncbi:acetate--CoA ligase family protein [Pseudorhodobacter turbinis]|uniref:Acetate--CoA ligase family protein n=1 Tax=Pseudorhodobacter turbinis TaxID=2500533 RepID=A0A4P8EF37_9RHOB|nr:acetate--CoA ligase family protein [Pseudorhodobacter turbinis]QCO55458.1 acetate--CoA ligase family protein [Pseudorhodobacter turbinis]